MNDHTCLIGHKNLKLSSKHVIPYALLVFSRLYLGHMKGKIFHKRNVPVDSPKNVLDKVNRCATYTNLSSYCVSSSFVGLLRRKN